VTAPLTVVPLPPLALAVVSVQDPILMLTPKKWSG
jgi:hypothetical protein